jgi:hypothetical protein
MDNNVVVDESHVWQQHGRQISTRTAGLVPQFAVIAEAGAGGALSLSSHASRLNHCCVKQRPVQSLSERILVYSASHIGRPLHCILVVSR